MKTISTIRSIKNTAVVEIYNERLGDFMFSIRMQMNNNPENLIAVYNDNDCDNEITTDVSLDELITALTELKNKKESVGIQDNTDTNIGEISW